MENNNLTIIESEVKEEIQGSLIIVDDPLSMEIASNRVLNLDAKRKAVIEYWTDSKKKAYDSWKAITAKEKEMTDIIDTARDSLKKKINIYLTECKRIENEKIKKAEEERKQKEEAERKRLAEEQRKAEEQKEKLELKGKTEKAEEKQLEIEMLKEKSEAIYIAPELIIPEVEKTTRTNSGTISGKEDIQIEIREKKALIESMLKDGLIDIIEIKEAKLKTWIKLMGKESYPGISIQKITTAIFRGKNS